MPRFQPSVRLVFVLALCLLSLSTTAPARMQTDPMTLGTTPTRGALPFAAPTQGEDRRLPTLPPSPTPTITPSPTPTTTPSATPVPTLPPSATPLPPTEAPTPEPTAIPLLEQMPSAAPAVTAAQSLLPSPTATETPVLYVSETPTLVPDLMSRIDSMTLEQKVAQMFLVTLHGSVMTEDGAAFLQRWQPGGAVLFLDNVGTPGQVTTLTNNFQRTITAAGGVPMLIAIDQEGNTVARLTDGFTVFPNPLLTTAAGEVIAYRVGAATAEELSAVGINMNLAPVADLETNLQNPVIYRRSYGSHPDITGRAIAALVRGTQDNGVLSTAKHFPGHGETREDSHSTLPIVDVNMERIRALETAPFRYAIDADVAAIMIGHLWYPAIDSERTPATLSYNVVTGLLRNEYGYNGLIVTDAMDMNAIDMEVQYQESMVRAVEAGVDLMALGPSFGLGLAENSITAVVEAVRSGRISEARIDESVRRIFAAKQRFGLVNWTPLDSDPEASAARVNMPAHEVLIEDMFRAGVTVAYDRGDLIPLDPNASIAFVFLGTRYQIKNECEQYAPGANVRWVAVGDSPTGDEIGWAARSAQEAEVAVVFTQEAHLNPAQQALVNAMPGDKTIAVALWSPYDWQTYPGVAAFVATYSPARPAVPAVCAILFGAQPATGQLPVSLSLALQAGTRSN